ncbi:hypothetical protein SMMN14_02855 [Sphaerulina musiva]
MKFTAVAISALVGTAFAAPEWTQPGGDHDYKPVAKRFVPGTDSIQLSKRIGPVGIAVASVLASGVLGFVGGPVANRALNDIFGVQKRSINFDLDINGLSFDEAREIYIDHLSELIIKENPYDGNDAGVCVGIAYKVSKPAAIVDAAAIKFTSEGQEHEYDCFVLQGPVTLEVASNATEADIAFVAPKSSTWSGGVLTLTE